MFKINLQAYKQKFVQKAAKTNHKKKNYFITLVTNSVKFLKLKKCVLKTHV